MKVISFNPTSRPRLKNTCAAIGIFDGVHRGHQYLISHMLKAARRLKATPIVITFFPHPAHVLKPDLKLAYLTSFDDRLRLLGGLGVAVCVVVRFSRTFAKMEPEVFIRDILAKRLGVKAIFVGDDFCFGRNRSGDIALFERLADECGYEIHAIPALNQGGSVISSTRLRRLIAEGKLKQAASLLERPVFVSGKVVQGARRGKSLGFPTANIAYEADVLPPRGVYVVRLVVDGKKYPAMANLGTRPSFDNSAKLHLEVHVLDFSKDLYGRHVEVEFLQKIRNEKKFDGPQELIVQITKDETFARRYFRKGGMV